MSIKGQGHSLTLVRGHSDFKVKCLTFGLYTQVSDSGPYGPLVPHCLQAKLKLAKIMTDIFDMNDQYVLFCFACKIEIGETVTILIINNNISNQYVFCVIFTFSSNLSLPVQSWRGC